MKPQTKKQKGSEFERDIAKSLRDAGLDPDSRRMPLSGGAYGLPTDVRTSLPLAIECKRQEKTKFAEWYEQSEYAAPKNKIPVVAWRENHGQPFVFLKWNDFLEICSFAVKGGWTDRLPFHK